ncbi:MG2 domain-containing protein [Marispirochaeta aestuarii]|uniref:alpha-2-macroglobulin family protein n=1 Tax=Marispirochaeta aestuarii TaxID=1963862 RepID=UPI0029C8FC6A|nr:MG2 domain-containing protein [Marispirochaeta aestuarii]
MNVAILAFEISKNIKGRNKVKMKKLGLILQGFIFPVLSIFFAVSIIGCGGAPEVSFSSAVKGGAVSEALQLGLKESSLTRKGGIVYYEAEAKGGEYFSPRETDDPLIVTAYGPVGELPVEMKRPDIYVTFNQPMVPLSKLGDPLKTHPHLSIEPPVDGFFRWYGSRLLSFEPSQPFDGQREYRVSLKRGIASLGGKKLDEALEFTFHTEHLDFSQVYAGKPESFGLVDQDDVPPETARHITCEFTWPVNPEFTASFLSVRSGNTEYSFRAERPGEESFDGPEQRLERTLVLTLDRILPEDSDVQVVLKSGAASDEGYLGRTEESMRSFRTLKPFIFRRMRSYSYTFPGSDKGDANPLFLEFSHPLGETEPEEIAPFITTSLEVDDIADHIEIWDNIIKLNNLPVDYESVYRVDIASGLRDVHGRSLASGESLEVEVGPATRYYYFPDTGSRMLEAQFDPKIIYEYQNVFDGLWHISSIEDPYSSFDAKALEPYDFSSLPRNTKHFEVLDLSPYLNPQGFGTVGISWNFGEEKKGKRNPWEQRNLQLQVTDIGITTRIAHNRALVWAASLSTGEPIAGARVELLRNRTALAETLTDESGLGEIFFSEGEYSRLFLVDGRDRLRIRVSNGADRAEFIPNGSHNQYHFGVYSFTRPGSIEEERMEAFIFTDRGLYRKGETVTFRGIDRSWSAGKYSPYRGPYTLEVSERRYRAEVFHRAEGTSSASGGFYGSFTLPEDLEPGQYRIIYRREGHTEELPFTVAEFRRAAFEVKLESPERLLYSGDTVNMTGTARFLSGGSLAGGLYHSLWMREPWSYVPPGTSWRDYRFAPRRWGGLQVVEEDRGALDGTGTVLLSLESGGDQIPGLPYRYQAELAVRDQSRQELAARTSALVHPAAFYIGSRFLDGHEGSWSTFVKAGEKVSVEAVFVRPDGAAYSGLRKEIRGELIRRSWQVSRQRGVYDRLNNRYELVEEPVSAFDLEAGKEKLEFEITPPEAGEYVLRISAADGEGRRALSEIDFYATGSSYVQWNQPDPGDIELVPDREQYSPGDTARILVKSPLPSGTYLLTVEREGIVEERFVDLSGSAATIDVPVRGEHIPVVYVALSSHTRRSEAPKSYFDPDLGKPRGLFGIARLRVSPESLALDVSVSQDKTLYRPGEEGRARIRVSSGGVPVEAAEVTLLAVDRGVVDLVDYHVPDPMSFFYAEHKFPLGVLGADSRSLLINPVTYEVRDLQGGDGDDEGKLERRKDFSPLAVFEPVLLTGPDGYAEAVFTLPDTLTTYRVTAVAVKGNRFGLKEEELAVRNPITMRAALPRKLRMRDTAEAGVVLTNLSAEVQEIDLACTSPEPEIRVHGESRKSLSLGPGESREVTFTLLAEESGEAKLEFTLRSGVLSEILESTLTVDTPLVRESFTIAGTLDESDTAQEALLVPSSIAPGYGSISLRLSPNPLGPLKDLVERLLKTDYEILEGEMFRVLPHLVLKDKLEFFNTVHDSREVEKFFTMLKGYQNRDGGFGYRPGGEYSSAWLSVRLAHYLALARDGDFEVQEPDTDRLMAYLKGLYGNGKLSDFTRIYSLYVRSLLGDRPEEEMQDALSRGDAQGISGYALLALSFNEIGRPDKGGEILERVRKFLKLGTRSLDITETYEKRFYFDSELTALSLLQMALHSLDDPASLLTQVQNTLIQRQRYGRWGTLNDSTWVLISFAESFRDFIESSGELNAEVSLQGQTILSASSENPEPVSAELPLFEEPAASLPRDTLLPLSFNRSGSSPVFYSGTISYGLPAEAALPRDEGFSVYTSMESLDGKKVTTLAAGETYRVRVTVSSARDRSMALLRVPVPSGCEIVDANLVSTRSYAEEGGADSVSFQRETVYGEEITVLDEGYYYPDLMIFRSLAPERKILDNEARCYFRHFYAGQQKLDFLVRATGKGIFPTPPAEIRGIYEEEVFGRGAGRLVIIE